MIGDQIRINEFETLSVEITIDGKPHTLTAFMKQFEPDMVVDLWMDMTDGRQAYIVARGDRRKAWTMYASAKSTFNEELAKLQAIAEWETT